MNRIVDSRNIGREEDKECQLWEGAWEGGVGGRKGTGVTCCSPNRELSVSELALIWGS